MVDARDGQPDESRQHQQHTEAGFHSAILLSPPPAVKNTARAWSGRRQRPRACAPPAPAPRGASAGYPGVIARQNGMPHASIRVLMCIRIIPDTSTSTKNDTVNRRASPCGRDPSVRTARPPPRLHTTKPKPVFGWAILGSNCLGQPSKRRALRTNYQNSLLPSRVKIINFAIVDIKTRRTRARRV